MWSLLLHTEDGEQTLIKNMTFCQVCYHTQNSLNKLWNRNSCNYRMLIQPLIQFLTFVRIQIYNFLLSIFAHRLIFGVISEYFRPFCKPWYVRLLWRKINSCVVCRIWYTCQICVVGRTIYFNEGAFCRWPENPFQLLVRKQRISTNKSLGRHFNQPKHRIQGEH